MVALSLFLPHSLTLASINNQLTIKANRSRSSFNATLEKMDCRVCHAPIDDHRYLCANCEEELHSAIVDDEQQENSTTYSDFPTFIYDSERDEYYEEEEFHTAAPTIMKNNSSSHHPKRNLKQQPVYYYDSEHDEYYEEEEYEPMMKKKRTELEKPLLLRDFSGDVSKAGLVGKLSDVIVMIVMTYAPARVLRNLVQTCKWVHSVFLVLYSHSNISIQLEYVNARCQQYKSLTSLYRMNGENDGTCFDIMKDDHTLVLPNKFGEREQVLIDAFSAFSEKERQDRKIKKLDDPFSLLNGLCWPSQFVKSLDQFSTNLHTRGGSDLASILMTCLWKHNLNNKEQFILAGGFIMDCISTGTTNSGDIDIFCILNGQPADKCHASLRNLLFEFENMCKQKQLKYAIIKNDSCMNIYPYSPGDEMGIGPKTIQIVLRRFDTIEELLVYFDIDICKFSFDGTRVLTTRDALLSATSYRCFAPKEHRFSGRYNGRAKKYFRRGFETFFLDLHPLDQFLDPQYRSRLVFYHNLNYAPVGRFKYNGSGMYSIFNSMNVTYASVLSIRQTGVESYLNYHSYELGSWNMLEIAKNGDQLSTQQKVELAIRRVTEEDIHYFCTTFRELYMKDVSLFLENYNFESHLRDKYNFWKCYMCGFYRHCYELSLQDKKTGKVSKICDHCKYFNDNMKKLKRDLTGKTAIVTGARIKIGFETARVLLDNGATVIATTRFPTSAYENFSKCENFKRWKNKLYIYPLNLKEGPSILAFCDYVHKNFSKIDFLINK